MDEQTAKEIKRLREEFFKRKEAISGIKDLVKNEIDREFPVNLWELSQRELDNEMGNRLSFLNEDIDPRPDIGSITSHRRFLGKPIVMFKRLFMRMFNFYTNKILENQWRFNDQLVVFHLASFIRFRHNERKIKEIEERLKTIEEDQELLLEQLEVLKNERNKP